MITAIKYVTVAMIAAGVAWGSGYHTGCLDEHGRVYNQAHQSASAYFYRQAKIDQRTARIIAAQSHKEGFNECQEQF